MRSIAGIMQGMANAANSYGQNDPYFMVRQSQRMGEPISLVDAQNILSKRQEQQQQAALQQALPQIAGSIDYTDPNKALAQLISMGIDERLATTMVQNAMEQQKQTQKEQMRQSIFGGGVSQGGTSSDISTMPDEQLVKLAVFPEYANVVTAEMQRRQKTGEIETKKTEEKTKSKDQYDLATDTLKYLYDAQELNKIAPEGYTAGLQTAYSRVADPKAEKATAGAKLNRILGEQVLSNLKQLGANPTEGERAFLKELYGATDSLSGMTRPEREQLITMGIEQMEKRRARFANKAGIEIEPLNNNKTTMPEGARQGKDGNFYVADPKRPGKYLRVVQ